MERNTNMHYFNYDAYKALLEKIKNADSVIIEAVDMAMKSFCKYVTEVDGGEQAVMIASLHCDGEEFREVVSRYDSNRRIAHESAISSVTMINRIAAMYEVEPIFEGDVNERLQVADFRLDVSIELFKHRSL